MVECFNNLSLNEAAKSQKAGIEISKYETEDSEMVVPFVPFENNEMDGKNSITKKDILEKKRNS